jgi:hypothetical protein
MSRRGPPTVTLAPDAEDLERTLQALQRAALAHPAAAAGLFRALVAEGRAWARTPEGKALRDRLAGAPILDRVRLVFDKATGDWLSADGELLPSTMAEAVVIAAGRPDAEQILDHLAWGRRRDG